MQALAAIATCITTLFKGIGSAAAWIRSLFRKRDNAKIVDAAQVSGDTSDIESRLNK